ncbi:hypothetical protein [Mycobacterium sp. EPa45]|uniref:hypothetical protein n=1 Tax=Mycobacterium sp. EPa45 TaxID=1545728 RepID=UPI000642042B|nr:hypothetical protein [Mycobacterium sp. EPa45]AKK28318.1 hypothetical protein AB431_18330 [Mycobacterium sp. EPa45]
MTATITPRRHRVLAGAAVIAAATGLLGCTAAPGSAEPGVEMSAAQVPWDRVGAGWMLASWNPVPGRRPGEQVPDGEPRVAPSTLFLLDPNGRRYHVGSLPVVGADPANDNPGYPVGLADWSRDGRHALLQEVDRCPQTHDAKGWHCTDPSAPEVRTTITDIDLTTGVHVTFEVPAAVAGEYAGPTDRSVLLSPGYTENSALRRVDLTGAEQVRYPTDLGAAGRFTGSFLSSSDGTQLVAGGDKGMAMVGEDGVVGRTLPVPDTITKCRPVRWWTPSVVLADCTDIASKGDQLWTVPTDGGQPAALTAPNTGQRDSGFDRDLHDADAWQLPGGTYIQSLGACGTVFVSRLTSDMHTTPVTIPGLNSSSVAIVGTAGDKLIVEGHAGCGPGTSLVAFDPAANTAKALLGPKVNGGSVQRAIIYPE